jgi:hypothetical protein
MSSATSTACATRDSKTSQDELESKRLKRTMQAEACSERRCGQHSESPDLPPFITMRLICHKAQGYQAQGDTTTSVSDGEAYILQLAALFQEGQPVEVTSSHCVTYNTPQVGRGHYALHWLAGNSYTERDSGSGSNISMPLNAAIAQINCSRWLAAALSSQDIHADVQPTQSVDHVPDMAAEVCDKAPADDRRARSPLVTQLQLLLSHSAVWRHSRSQRPATVCRCDGSAALHAQVAERSRDQSTAESANVREANIRWLLPDFSDVAADNANLLQQLGRHSAAIMSHAAGAICGVLLWNRRLQVATWLSSMGHELAWSFIQPQVTRLCMPRD